MCNSKHSMMRMMIFVVHLRPGTALCNGTRQSRALQQALIHATDKTKSWNRPAGCVMGCPVVAYKQPTTIQDTFVQVSTDRRMIHNIDLTWCIIGFVATKYAHKCIVLDTALPFSFCIIDNRQSPVNDAKVCNTCHTTLAMAVSPSSARAA